MKSLRQVAKQKTNPGNAQVKLKSLDRSTTDAEGKVQVHQFF